jgi:hypothetical protein
MSGSAPLELEELELPDDDDEDDGVDLSPG